jgi:hypothetical protein
MSQKLELKIDEVIVLENSNGQDTIVLNIWDSEAIKDALPAAAVLFYSGMLSVDIKTSSMCGQNLAKELGLVPDRIVKV